MNKKKIDKKAIAFIIVMVILFILSILYFYCKRTLLMDESYTFALSNCFNEEHTGWVAYNPHGWIDTSVFDEYVVTDKAFKYRLVSNNQYWDCHPPLYYYLIHTISSILKGRFSLWFGFIVNCPCYLINCILIYFIILKLTKKRETSIISTLLYGLNYQVLELNNFIRMYQLVSTFVLIYVYLALQIVSSEKERRYLYIFLFIDIILGGLTHYYFYVAALIFSLAILVYLVIKRRFKKLLISLSIFMFATCLNIFYFFNGTLRHLTAEHGSYTTSTISSLSFDFDRYSIFVKDVWCGEIIFYIGIIFLFGCIIALICKNNKAKWPVMFLSSYYAYFLVVSQIATYTQERYMTPMITIHIIGLMMAIELLINQKTVKLLVLISLIVLNIDLSAIRNNFGKEKSWDFAKKHQDDIAIVISPENNTYGDFYINSYLFADLRWYIGIGMTDMNDEFEYQIDRESVLYVEKSLDEDGVLDYVEENILKNSDYQIKKMDNILVTNYNVYLLENTNN